MLPITIIDAFTDKPFSGNPAGVCVTDAPLPDDLMQNIAAELNLSETAFLVPLSTEVWSLRWFTPAIEIELCGHATLASAHHLIESGRETGNNLIRFHTLSGELTARKVGDKIELDFPAVVTQPLEFETDVSTALGVKPIHTGRKGRFTLFEFDSEQTVRSLNPDLKTLVALGLNKFVVTARSDNPEFDIVSRFFAPGAGIDEDPVTGSAHCVLAPYWAPKLGKQVMQAYQASQRGGKLEIELKDDRVLLRGHAKTIIQANLLI